MTEGKKHVWNSRRKESLIHNVKGVNGMWFRSETESEKYRLHRRLIERAKRNGFPTDEEGLHAFQAWENRQRPKLTHKKKIERIQRLIDRGDQSLADFAHAVINIVEDRSH